MPIFDRQCESCQRITYDLYEPVTPPTVTCACGGTTTRVWTSTSAAVRDDTYIGGLTVENLGPTPVTFHSRSEHRRYMEKHEIREAVRHVGAKGSDKSKHTVKWT